MKKKNRIGSAAKRNEDRIIFFKKIFLINKPEYFLLCFFHTVGRLSCLPSIIFSTYLPNTSNSRFTLSPTFFSEKIVSCHVKGIIPTPNQFSSSSATVILTPSIEIEPT